MSIAFSLIPNVQLINLEVKAELTLVQLDHFGGWGFLATRKSCCLALGDEERKEKKNSSTISAVGKLVAKLVGDDFGGLWICT